ncbi:Cadmium-induced protein AS8 [Linum perenne]
MIIKGIFRRYERWNPVHPTIGAFWGMGLGIGCGVGWGPGFGPEVIGYVGSGCGVGFSVGFTLAGVGIGLPANYIFQAPYSGLIAAVRGIKPSQLMATPFALRDAVGDGWNSTVAPCFSQLQREASGRLGSFGKKLQMEKGSGLELMKDKLSIHTRSVSGALETCSCRLFAPRKGTLATDAWILSLMFV